MQRIQRDVPTLVRDAVRVPSGRTPARSGLRRAVAALLCAVGLFTVSWDRFGNVGLAQYNVKLPVVLLSVAALLLVPEWWTAVRGWVRARRDLRWIVVIAGALVLLYCVRAVFVAPFTAGAAQIVALGTGAIAPALAVIGLLRVRADVVWALRWLLAGAVLAGLFGLWQLIAFYTGLPQIVAYTGVGTTGAGGRIAAFSYEPAYFAYFLVLAIGCRIALARLTGTRVGWWSIGFFGVLLALVNARSLLFLLPVAAVLIAVAWRAHRALLLRSVIAAAVLAVLSIGIPVAIDAIPKDVAASVSPAPSGPEATSKPSTPSTSSPAGSGTKEVVPPQLPTNVLDPNEQSSNAPRLDLYRAVLGVDLQHPVLGVGPGGLREALAKHGYVAPNQGAQVVANNVWLQAAADGGVVLLLLEGAFVVLIAVLWWVRRREADQALLSVWLTVVLVGGMLTSYFFDVKLWVVLALAVASVGSQRSAQAPGVQTASASA